MFYCVPMYYRNVKFSETNLLLVPFVMMIKYRYHRNENISGTDLFACFFCYDEV